MEHRNPRTASRIGILGLFACLTVAALITVAPAAAAWAPTTPGDGSPGSQTATGGSANNDLTTTEAQSVDEQPAGANQPADPVVEPAPETVPVSTEAASAAAPTPVVAPVGPQLSIGIDNGRASTTEGDKLDYVITVQNLGTADVDGLRVNQSLPTGMEFGTADADGTADAGYVTWKVDLKATTTATFHTTMKVVATPAELLRLASVACASISADSVPIVCASHSDQLPAGAAAEEAQAAMVAPTTAEGQPWWYVLAGLGLVVVLGGLVLWWVRWKRRADHVRHDDELALTRQ